jgi:hypothetical protein
MREHPCDLCFDYFFGECSIEEQQAFERHLPDCLECKSELNDLRIAWEAIPVEMERIEPHEDLKKQVMDAVTGIEPSDAENSLNRKSVIQVRKWMGAAAAVLALLIIGAFWNNTFVEKQAAVIPIEKALSVSAAQIEQFIPLNPVSYDLSNAYGIACIVNNGQNKQFIVYVFDAKETIDEQAYQVWLVDENERRSAGTFRVDHTGVGVLAMPIVSDALTFDAISISLEPDDRGSQPRGTKMLESDIGILKKASAL